TAICSAVERDTARHSELAQASLAAEVAADMEHDFVEAFLQRRSDVAMIVARVAVRNASRDEVLFEVAARRAVGFAIKTLVVQAKKRNLDQAVVEQLHGLLEEMTIASGIPVGSESHDFVLVGVELEAKVQRESRIEDADGILSGDFGELVDLVVVRVINGDGVNFAHAVEDHDQAFIPSGGVVGAGGVGQMMIDVVNLVGGESWQMLVH